MTDTTIKNVSKNSFSWGHFGVILLQLSLSILLIYYSLKGTHSQLKIISLSVGVILLLLGILSLIPSFMHYGKDYEYVINMKN